jgi:hypothetical protein
MLDGKPVVEVVKGLAQGETVVTAGQIKIRGNNVPVRIAGAEAPAKGGGPAKSDAPQKADAPAKGAAPSDPSKKGS